MNVEQLILQFMILYFTNLILDYPLQGTFLAENKKDNQYILWVHCAIWGLGVSIILLPLGLFMWWKVIMLVGGHFIIDYMKCHERIDLYQDQLLHIMQLILCLI